MRSYLFFLVGIVTFSLLGVFLVVYPPGRKKAWNPANDLCPSLDRIISAADSDFIPIRGAFDESNSDDDDYDSRVHLPGSTYNTVSYGKDHTPPGFGTVLFRGIDSMAAYAVYMSTTLKFMACRPDFKFADKKDYDSLDAIVYGVYTFQDKVVYISYEKGEGDKEFFVQLNLAIDTVSPFYKKIRGIKEIPH